MGYQAPELCDRGDTMGASSLYPFWVGLKEGQKEANWFVGSPTLRQTQMTISMLLR